MDQQPHPLQGFKDQYDLLCAQRDALYAKVQPLEDELTAVNAQAEVARLKAAELASQIDATLGQGFIALKKQIGALARVLSAPGGLLATKE